MMHLNNQQSFRNNQSKKVSENIKNDHKKIKKILEQCYLVIADLKTKNKMLQDELIIKKSIINQLLIEKHQYLTHQSNCNVSFWKNQLEGASKKSEQMQRNFESILDNYERIITRYQHDIQRLKSFNKALRTDNTNLRNQASQINWRQRERKIGKITLSNKKQQNDEQNLFQFTVNRSQIIYPPKRSQDFKVQSVTPEKIITSKSTNISTAAKSNTKGSLSKNEQIPKNLFTNEKLIENTFQNAQNEDFQRSSEKYVPACYEAAVSVWVKRLRDLLTDSDQEN